MILKKWVWKQTFLTGGKIPVFFTTQNKNIYFGLFFSYLCALLNYLKFQEHMIMQKNTGIIKEFFGFVVRPDYNIKNEDNNWKQSVFKLIKLFLFCFILKIFAVYIINQTGIESGAVDRMIEKHSIIMTLLLGCIISPLIEEISYRLPLRFSVWNVTLSVFILSYDLITTFVFNTRYNDLGNYFAVRSGFALLAGIITYYLSKHDCERLQEFWTKHFRWILYFFCFYFAMLHITNYDLTTKIILL
ncbi:MAG: hypothetical protein LBQ64_02570, partial [Bacteroidales bacterium]|nr:hypothetical protein [Bacteroidales bacterium]